MLKELLRNTSIGKGTTFTKTRRRNKLNCLTSGIVINSNMFAQVTFSRELERGRKARERAERTEQRGSQGHLHSKGQGSSLCDVITHSYFPSHLLLLTSILAQSFSSFLYPLLLVGVKRVSILMVRTGEFRQSAMRKV